jgi:hypothetical protein
LRGFPFAIAVGSKESPASSRSKPRLDELLLIEKMQNFLGLITNHWLAKLLSLLLAVTLWAVIHSSVKESRPPSRIQFDNTKPSADVTFDIGNSIHGDRKK